MVDCFRCARTGVLFPSDYIEMWGLLYGIGLGSKPVSEALINNYHSAIAIGMTEDTTMHTMSVCKAQVDFVTVSNEQYAKDKAILDRSDQNYKIRSAMMRTKQLRKSNKMRSRFSAEATKLDKDEKEEEPA